MATSTRAPHPFLAADEPMPRVIAHRGFVPAGAAFAENTRDAFRAAWAAGARILESDCRVTRDGIVVLVHDADLSRVLGEKRRVADLDCAELAERFESLGGLLTLQAALEDFPEARFNIDVKEAAAARSAGAIVAPYAHRVLLTGFDDRVRRAALAAAAASAASASAGSADPEWSTAESTGVESTAVAPATSPGRSALVRVLLALALRSRAGLARSFSGLDALQVPERQGPLRIVTPRLIAAAHAHGVEVHVWTINDPDRMRALARMGVDGIITDRTDLALATLR